MDVKNYEVSVKKWGWTTMSFARFIRKYDSMEERLKIITNPNKCSVSHIYENRELSTHEALLLFANYDYSNCEKNFYDLEQYLDHYGSLDIEAVKDAKIELKSILLTRPTENVLLNYIGSFPGGFFHQEVKKLLSTGNFNLEF